MAKSAKENRWGLSGTMRIYGQKKEYKKDGKKKSFVTYSTSIGKKVGDEWINSYIDVRFSRDAEIEDTTGEVFIKINDAFLTLETWEKDGETRQKLIIMVTDCDVIE